MMNMWKELSGKISDGNVSPLGDFVELEINLGELTKRATQEGNLGDLPRASLRYSLVAWASLGLSRLVWASLSTLVWS